jgi:hypothetical protein
MTKLKFSNLFLLAALLSANIALASGPAPIATPASVSITAGVPVQSLVPLTASAASQLALARAAEEEAKTSGFFGVLGLSQYLLLNGAPLSYNLGVGYEFQSGFRLRTALENYFYAGKEDAVVDGNPVSYSYSYTYNNWSTTADYAFALLPWLRPIAGVSMDLIVNAQKARQDVKDAKQEAAQNFFGAGVMAGVLVKLTNAWEAQASARLISTFSAVPNVSVFAVEGVYHFR